MTKYMSKTSRNIIFSEDGHPTSRYFPGASIFQNQLIQRHINLLSDGRGEGVDEGCSVGIFGGLALGDIMGCVEGCSEGTEDGVRDGCLVGISKG